MAKIFKSGKIIIFFLFVSLIFARPVFCYASETSYFMSVLNQETGVTEVRKIEVKDGKVISNTKASMLESVKHRIQSETLGTLWNEILPRAGAKALNSALRNALNTIAFDTATWLASGNRGQKPMFITEGWGEYLGNVADNAAGTFIEKFGREGLGGYNLCDPTGLKAKIGLGLVQYSKPNKPSCTFTKMVDNWENSLQDPDFLTKFQDYFNPVSNDFGITLSMHALFAQEVSKYVDLKKLERIAGGGWLNLYTISGKSKMSPGEAERTAEELLRKPSVEKLGDYTGDALIDAANVFLNQFFITLINNLLRNLASGSDTYTSPYGGSLYNFESGGGSGADGSRGGIDAARSKFRQLIEPYFREGGVFDIVSRLATCPDPNKPGPTECVIDDRFKEAIFNKLTVGQALKGGYFNSTGPFGFISVEAHEPSYNEGYPYRSMPILRKFRIIPVNWEIAAQIIKEKFNSSEVGQTKSIQQLIDCFSPDDDYKNTGYDEPWCRGLIDPNWVLKAPSNFCRREGYGPEILSEKVIGKGEDSEVNIFRKDRYCADEQSCIVESESKACDFYGYCVEERQSWDYRSESCDPNYNTCQTFRKTDGKTVSFLENTLSTGICTADNTGCKGYCTAYNVSGNDLDEGKWNCTIPNISDKRYLDGSAATCPQSSEGCHELVRTKAAGANLLVNSSFEEDMAFWTPSDPTLAKAVDTEKSSGGKSLEIVNPNAAAATNAQQIIEWVMPKDVITVSYYVKTDLATELLSGAWVIVYPLNSSSLTFAHEYLKPGDACQAINCMEASIIKTKQEGFGEWTKREFTFNVPANTAKLLIQPIVRGVAGTAYFDAIKVERGGAPTDYSDYLAQGLVYEKLIPPYLEANCYIDAETIVTPATNFQLKAGAPAYCANFARKCNKEEVDCEMYTSAREGFKIPAKVVGEDYCYAECVGYDSYIQQSTAYDSKRIEYFIPKTAKRCGAGDAGCDEFTNLDRVELEGEQKEYYVHLRQCVKPSDPASDCSEFYTWEGSDESGYQLKVFQFKTDLATNEPEVTEPDGAECNEAIYNLPPHDPGYNPDCRQFYAKDGTLSYHLYPRTYTCDEDCHPYRRTEDNIVITLSDCNTECGGSPDCQCANDCSATIGAKACKLNVDEYVVCKSGGVWRNDHQACIYSAIPNQGRMCSAQSSGCREYSGNTGNNMRVIRTFNFESGTTEGWSGAGATVLANSNESLIVGGHSLYVNGGAHLAEIPLSFSLKEGSSYTLSLLIKGVGAGAKANIYFTDGAAKAVFAPADYALGGDWIFVRFNLEELDHPVVSTEKLVIEGNADMYLDSIKLTEIVNRYYLIKNSWNTPISCDNPLDNPTGGGCALNRCSIGEMLGCDQYFDRQNITHYLKKFTSLCQESAVGCELMIDTHNLAYPGSKIFPEMSAINPEVTVPADSRLYAVYDPAKNCGPSDKGCKRFGSPYIYGSEAIYDSVFLLDNPEQYEKILCDSQAEGCAEFNYSEGLGYFKDPGEYNCEYRKGGPTGSTDWWVKKIKRCAVTASICREEEDCADFSACASDSECEAVAGAGNAVCLKDRCHYVCQPEDDDKICPVEPSGGNPPATLGPGLVKIFTPADDFAGICPASESGCTEYIDPLSEPSANVASNPRFADLDGDGSSYDTWDLAGPYYSQTVILDKNTLYVLNTDLINAKIMCDQPGLFDLNEANQLIGPKLNTLETNESLNSDSLRFYSLGIGACKLMVGNSGALGAKQVALRKAVVDYQLRDKIDKQSCAGIVNYGEGCILFNERKVDTAGSAGNYYAGLEYDADKAYGLVPAAPEACTPGDGYTCDSNIILKVYPDRVCKKWLACRSYVELKDDKGKPYKVCYDIGECSTIDQDGSCTEFLPSDQKEQEVNIGDYSAVSSLSGYNKAGLTGASSEEFEAYYPLAAMEQIGEVVYLPNGHFEFYGGNKYPVGWYPVGATYTVSKNWNANLFSVVNNPIQAQTEDIRYPREGKAFLKYSPAAGGIISEMVDVIPDTVYSIAFDMNTIGMHAKNAGDTVLAGIGLITYDSAGVTSTHPGLLDAKFDLEYVDGSVGDLARFGMLFTDGGGKDWEKHVSSFKVGSRTHRLRIYIFGDPEATGNVYFDNIQIKPALKVQSGLALSEVGQNCRLFPENDSLACSYFEDSGKIMKGWPGYCLQYDRKPGNPDACVLWYPVDRVKGDGIEEGAGYTGKFPSYYCLYAKGECAKENIGGNWVDVPRYTCQTFIQTVTPTGQNKFWSGRVYEGSAYEIFFAETGDGAKIDLGSAGKLENVILDYQKNSEPYGSMAPPEPLENPYEWTGGPFPVPVNEERAAGTPYYGNDFSCNSQLICGPVTKNPGCWGTGNRWTCEGYDSNNPDLCWAGGCTHCPADYMFVSRYGPDPGNPNPNCTDFGGMGGSACCWASGMWEGRWAAAPDILCSKNISARYDVAISIDQAEEGLKRIFAQSYGTWAWDGSHYVRTDDSGWGPPAAFCAGPSRPAYPNDYCAVRPIVSNITVNGLSGGSATFPKNNFVNLKFNSSVDSQQLPLTMFAVDWGDGENTVVSGIEMRDRPNLSEPHSLYHLYDYYDLKRKDAATPSIHCNDVPGGPIPTVGLNCDPGKKCCATKPGVIIKDNWNWCNNGMAMNDCDGWNYYPDWIIISDR